MRTREQLEAFYSVADPWQFQVTEDDLLRKNRILSAVVQYGPYDRALDIGAGEGWITADLPAQEIHAIEISDHAAARFPLSVHRVSVPDGAYDLVLATGVFYDHYNREQMHRWALDAWGRVLVTCHIAQHEVPLPGYECAYSEVFQYRGKYQRLKVYLG